MSLAVGPPNEWLVGGWTEEECSKMEGPYSRQIFARNIEIVQDKDRNDYCARKREKNGAIWDWISAVISSIFDFIRICYPGNSRSNLNNRATSLIDDQTTSNHKMTPDEESIQTLLKYGASNEFFIENESILKTILNNPDLYEIAKERKGFEQDLITHEVEKLDFSVKL